MIEALFHTLTNVDFDPDLLKATLARVAAKRDLLVSAVAAKGGSTALPGGKTPTKLDPAVEGANIVRKRIDNVQINTALSNSFGFGGTNASLVFQRLEK